ALAFSGVRFQTVTSWPASISRAAIAAPILPIPAIPSFIPFSPHRHWRAWLQAPTVQHQHSGALSASALVSAPRCPIDKPVARVASGCDSVKLCKNRSGTAMPRGKKATVGVIGLGIMGGAFAHNLIAAGWRVIGYDIAPARRRAMAKLG